jgi:1-aminocyclopropane-1-carboxylate deaminase
MLNYNQTATIELFNKSFEDAALRVFIKREDLNHPQVSGNKWWKLKYNLEEAQKQNYKTVLTFGGAFSNHIYATAAAAKELGLKSVGIIRGEEVLPLNKTLAFAKNCGMDFYYVSREEYRKKDEPEFLKQLENRFGDFYLIPEGGTNQFAVKGCAEFTKEKLNDVDFDYLCLPVGTGGTMAGIIAGLEGRKKIIGFSVLKNGGFLTETVSILLKEFSVRQFSNWHLELDYHFGGYAKHSHKLDQFILKAKVQYNLPLDFVYTGKMVSGVFDLIAKNYFMKGSKILMLHTGGLRN